MKFEVDNTESTVTSFVILLKAISKSNCWTKSIIVERDRNTLPYFTQKSEQMEEFQGSRL